MSWKSSAAIGFGVALLLPGCANNYATFVTSTDIGISADATTEDLHLGYVRTELFVGPGYPDTGAALPAVGYLDSNLNAFSPKITQVYATGAAAELVTQPTNAKPPADKEPPSYSGDRRPLIFGTGSNIGLRVGFTSAAPSSVKFGFNREEISLIPLRRALSGTDRDEYAPVLASIHMDQTGTDLTGTHVQLTQFFATGTAAKNLAQIDALKQYFQEKAKSAVKGPTDALNNK